VFLALFTRNLPGRASIAPGKFCPHVILAVAGECATQTARLPVRNKGTFEGERLRRGVDS
jgi:hypothetical protein